MLKMIEFLRWSIPIWIVFQLYLPGSDAVNGGNCAIDARCPRFDTGNSAVLIPHPDCTKFYKCALGKACEYLCPANLHFNPILLTCDYPAVACCSRDVVCTGTTPGLNPPAGIPIPPPFGNITSGGEWLPSGLQNSTLIGSPNLIRPQETVITNPSIQANPAPIRPQEPVVTNPNIQGNPVSIKPQEMVVTDIQANPAPIRPQESIVTDSNNRGQGVPQIIQEIQNSRPHFNESPSNSGIFEPEDSSRHQNQETSSLGGSESSTNEFNGAVSISSRPGCVVDSRCSSSEALNSEKPLFLKHSNCEKFYMCSGGEACEVDCPEGLHFNVQQSRCDYQDAACCDTSKPCARNNIEVPMSSCIPDVRCSTYDNPMNPTHLPHPTNCNRFFKCSYGKACELPCPPGEHFSVAMNRCEFPEVACCDRSIACQPRSIASERYPESRDEPVEEVVPPSYPMLDVPEEPPLNDPETRESDSVISATTPETIRINTCFEVPQCPDGGSKKNQLMRHNDCTKFFSCFERSLCEFVCPPGLHFNERLKVCDKPENAKCSQAYN